MELLGLALLMFLGRVTVDIIATIKGTTPPHIEKARLRAEQRRRDAEAGSGRDRSPYASGKPTLKDVAAVYWGDAMADAIDSHDRRRAEKKKAREAAKNGTPVPVGPSLRDRAKRFGQLLLNGPQPATKEGVDPAKATQEILNADWPATDWPLIACDECGSTLIDATGGWKHPDGAVCSKADTAPASTTEYSWSCSTCHRWVPGFATQAEADAAAQEHARTNHNDAAVDHRPASYHGPSGFDDPDDSNETPVPPKDDEGDDMTDTSTPTTGTATGDAHDLESAIQQCDLLGDDLTRIDTSLDVIDEAIGSAGAATELIEAFLRSKSVDDTTVGGMSSAREMLSPDRIKALIDAVSAAKAGVQSTKELLEAMNDGATAALNGADGSIVNGR